MSAESSVQCAAGLWPPQPNCGLLSGNITEDLQLSYKCDRDFREQCENIVYFQLGNIG